MNKKNTFYFSLVLVLIANLLANHFSFNIDLTEDKKYKKVHILIAFSIALTNKIWVQGNKCKHHSPIPL